MSPGYKAIWHHINLSERRGREEVEQIQFNLNIFLTIYSAYSATEVFLLPTFYVCASL